MGKWRRGVRPSERDLARMYRILCEVAREAPRKEGLHEGKVRPRTETREFVRGGERICSKGQFEGANVNISHGTRVICARSWNKFSETGSVKQVQGTSNKTPTFCSRWQGKVLERKVYTRVWEDLEQKGAIWCEVVLIGG